MLRPYRPEDAPDFLRLLNLARSHDTSLQYFLSQEAAWPPAQFRRRAVAVSAGREGGAWGVIGMAELRHFEYHPPGWPLLTLSVDPAARGQGVGAELLHWAMQGAAELQVGGLGGTVLDSDPASPAWAERRGFSLHAHRFASVLDLSRPQPAPQLPAGVIIRDLSGAGEAEWERLMILYGDLLTQTPDLAGQPRWTREQLRAHTQDNPRSRPEWTLLAVSGAGEWLALCQGTRISSGMYNEFTGTVAGARGQGLARALKLELIRRARAAGIESMRTNNHAANAPMLRVNERLGFVRLPGTWELRTWELRRALA